MAKTTAADVTTRRPPATVTPLAMPDVLIPIADLLP
jgi:hypothetical protein